ncbi:MAG: hypothetical protein QOC58_401, partial [Mycobacterium sp.]|nr:hypothetical protein [Mycobacterium sp.]
MVESTSPLTTMRPASSPERTTELNSALASRRVVARLTTASVTKFAGRHRRCVRLAV